MSQFFSDKALWAIVRGFFDPRTWQGALVYAAILVLVAMGAARAVRLLAQRALARRRHPHLDRTVVQFLSQLAQVIVWILAVMVFLHVVPALQKLGTALLAGVSLASVVIGLAAQTTLSNFIAGCSLVLYRPFEVDDQIEITGPGGPVIGIIERLTPGYTMLRTFDDRRIIVPNNVMANQISVRGNHAKLRAMAMIPIVVMDIASAARVKQFLLTEGRAYPGVIDVISCLEQPMEPQGVALSLRLWCRNENIAIAATNDIGAAVADQSRQAGIDILIPPALPLKDAMAAESNTESGTASQDAKTKGT